MQEEITNAVLAAKLDGLRELMELKFEQNEASHKMVNDHLASLNGQTEKNTEFRVKGSMILALVTFLASTLAITIINKML